jgi:hypothetical protein
VFYSLFAVVKLECGVEQLDFDFEVGDGAISYGSLLLTSQSIKKTHSLEYFILNKGRDFMFQLMDRFGTFMFLQVPYHNINMNFHYCSNSNNNRMHFLY